MYRSVIIEGSTTPASGVLARGERKTVQLTPRVQRLINRGFVVVVELLDLPNIPDAAPLSPRGSAGVDLSTDDDDATSS